MNDEIMELALEMLREQNRVLKDQVAHLEEVIANRNFAELMKINVLAELAKARAEERERCAKVCDAWANARQSPNDISALQQCVEVIRALKD